MPTKPGQPLFKLGAAGRECFRQIKASFEQRGEWQNLYAPSLTVLASDWDRLFVLRKLWREATDAKHRRQIRGTLNMTYLEFAELAGKFFYEPKPRHWLTWFLRDDRPHVELLRQCLGL